MSKRIYFVVFPGFQILDLAGPAGAFETAASSPTSALYALSFVSARGGLIASSSGAAVQTRPFPDEPFDTMMVMGGPGVYAAAACETTLAYLREAGRRAERVASVCSGAYLLAAAGLLDGKRATTHWSRAADLQRRYPKLKVEQDRIFVKDGTIWTSAGVTAGIDLALAMITEDAGEQVAKKTARELVVFYRRPGGQSQFSALLEMSPATDRIARVLDRARQDLSQDLSVERLASIAAMSPRQFSRVFLAETGHTPAKAIERLRVEAARPAVEEGVLQFDVIARQHGFFDADGLRRAFLRTLGMPPQALRRGACPAAMSPH